MPNLRERLKIIQSIKKENANHNDIQPLKAAVLPGWEKCGDDVYKRQVILEVSGNIKEKLPKAIEILIPDLQGKVLPHINDFLFFDLETTGLSGGAGTIAFLAAFGRFTENHKLLVTQYLLTDYPGESDFLNAVLKEINGEGKEKIPGSNVIVTYNGKCFDTQIIKSRFIMHGLRLPFFYHVDLLHPARRLWRNLIYDCSQANVENKILGLEREGDIPGSQAPDIWFEYLKTGKTERLIGICDHNVKDIYGLAELLGALITIADDPLNQTKYQYDLQRTAFFWRYFLCKGKKYLLPQYREFIDTCEKLLKLLVNSNSPDHIKTQAQKFLRILNYKW